MKGINGKDKLYVIIYFTDVEFYIQGYETFINGNKNGKNMVKTEWWEGYFHVMIA